MSDKPVWEKALPKGHHTKHLSHQKVEQAKAKARMAGRPYPNAVDNIAVARAGHKRSK